MNATPSSSQHRWQQPVVWAVTAAMAGLSLLFITLYGRNLPYADDFILLPIVGGLEPFTWGWLWQQQNEHRFPIGRGIFFLLAQATHLDSRAGMVVNALLLSATAFWVISSLRFYRGELTLYDCAFPLLILHWGHYHNLLMNIQVFVVTAAAATLGVACFALRGGWNRWSGIAGYAVLISLLCVSGGNGLPIAACHAAFAAWTAYTLWQSPGKDDRRRALAMLSIAVGVGVMVSLYFTGWARPPHHPPPRFSKESIRGTGEFLAISFGPVAITGWRYFALAAGGGILGGALLLLRSFFQEPHQRIRVAALLCSLAGMSALAAGIGISRGVIGPGIVLDARFVTIAMPLLFTLLLILSLAKGQHGRRLYKVAAAAIIVLMLSNMVLGSRAGSVRARGIDTVLQEMAQCRPLGEIAKEHYMAFFPFEPTGATRYLQMLCNSRLGPYHNPPLRQCGCTP